MAASRESGLLNPVVVLLLGETQSGKSSAGNSILGRRAFPKNTTGCSRENGTILGKQVIVVDTPGWFSNADTPERVSQEICKSLALCYQEPHAILLTLPINSVFSDEKRNAMEDQLRQLQISIWNRTIILFTYGDKLEGTSIQQHIRHQGRALHWLLERCGNRYQVLTNQPSVSETQVRELFRMIQGVMRTDKPSRDIQNILYTQLREDVCKEGWSWQERKEEFEMTVMYDVQDRRPGKASGRQQLSTDSLFVFEAALSFILLGRAKSGKSSAGNVLLDKDEFQVHQYRRTTKCSVGRGKALHRAVTVVDTPGWSFFGRANPGEVKREIKRSVSLCPDGSKVTLLLCIPVDSFGERDRRAVDEFVSTFRDDVWSSTVVVFTFGENLDGKAVEKHIQKTGEPLQAVLRKCGNRHVVFDAETEDMDEVQQLLEIVDTM